MSSHEVLLAYAWLQTTLQGDATLLGYAPGGVFRSLADPNVSAPYVIVSFQAGSDSVTMNGFRVLTQATYQVKAVGPAKNTVALANASARIDALLGGPPSFPPGGIAIVVNAVSVGWLYACYRDAPLSVDELVSGELWSNFGGLYRLQVGQIY